MSRPLRFGVLVLPNTDYAEQVRRWQHVESLGFDSLWDCDHFVNPYTPSQTWFEGWTLLAAMATQTQRVRIGTLVTAAPFHNPAFLARQCLTLDHISGGRLNIGIGAGSVNHDPSYAMSGIPDYSPAERVGRLHETVAILDTLLHNRTASYKGEYYQVNEAMMNPAPLQQLPPPLTIAALGAKTLRIAAQYADTWNFYPSHGLSLAEAIAETRQRTALLEQYCTEFGRDPQTINRSLLFFSGPNSGLTDDFADTVGRYREVGVNEFIVYYPPSDAQLPTFERIAQEVIPNLRDAALSL